MNADELRVFFDTQEIQDVDDWRQRIPLLLLALSDAADPKADQALARWIDEIQLRQTFDPRPWQDAGEAYRLESALEPAACTVLDFLP